MFTATLYSYDYMPIGPLDSLKLHYIPKVGDDFYVDDDEYIVVDINQRVYSNGEDNDSYTELAVLIMGKKEYEDVKQKTVDNI